MAESQQNGDLGKKYIMLVGKQTEAGREILFNSNRPSPSRNSKRYLLGD